MSTILQEISETDSFRVMVEKMNAVIKVINALPENIQTTVLSASNLDSQQKEE